MACVSRGPRPAGARGGGAICCVAAPAEAMSHWDDTTGGQHRQMENKAPPAKPIGTRTRWFSRGAVRSRLISEAQRLPSSLPVFQRGWGRIIHLVTSVTVRSCSRCSRISRFSFITRLSTPRIRTGPTTRITGSRPATVIHCRLVRRRRHPRRVDRGAATLRTLCAQFEVPRHHHATRKPLRAREFTRVMRVARAVRAHYASPRCAPSSTNPPHAFLTCLCSLLTQK
jgi:hypothetical protein